MSEAPVIQNELRSMGAQVAPTRDGFAFTLRGTAGRVTERQPDDAVEGWSLHCRVPLHMPAPRFELDVRPRTPDDRRLVEAGQAVHVRFDDDSAFERAFVVEAAPSDLVRAVLDDAVRGALADLAPCRLRREGDVLHLATGPSRGDARVETIVSVCVGLAERLVRARESLDGVTEEDDRRARTELEELHDARSHRRQLQGAPFGMAMIALLVAGAMIAILAHC